MPQAHPPPEEGLGEQAETAAQWDIPCYAGAEWDTLCYAGAQWDRASSLLVHAPPQEDLGEQGGPVDPEGPQARDVAAVAPVRRVHEPHLGG